MKKLALFVLVILTVLAPIRIVSAGGFYAVKRTDIGASSVNIPFGFVPTVVQIQAASTNADEVCIDWSGGTAVCPAADTAGDDALEAGSTITIDGFGTRSISVIAASGTLTVYVRGWR